jgi:SAM-dependent methyltransferase
VKKDVWAAGSLYEPYVGRWSRLVAPDFLAWLGVPEGRKWLDVGCGTGALTQCILRNAAPAGVHGVDPSAGFIEHAEAHTADARASFEVGDAQALPAASASFDAAVAGLVVNFVPEPERAVTEMRRAVRPGGSVAAYVWDYAEKMELMRHFWDAAVALNPQARALDEGVRFPLCRPEPLAALFEQAGLSRVEVKAIDVPTRFRDFDDYWTPFLGGQAPAPGYCMSLDEEKRGALRERIRSKLPFRPDGSIDLIARAWAVKGLVPRRR